MKKLLLIFLLFTIIGKAQNTLQFLSANTGAACQSIKYYNGYVFTGTGSTLRSYYAGSGATVPYNSVFEYRYTSEIIRMIIHDHYLYVAANYDGMSKWDISNPVAPVKLFDIPVDSVNMSTQGIAIKGDTIFLAQYAKVLAYKDFGSSYSKIGSFGNVPFGGHLTGVAVKNNLLAYTVSQFGGQNGVYIYNANNFSFVSFHQLGGFYTENVIFGKNNNLLHVMGGTNSTNGYFFTLDVTNPLSPQKVFGDTVLGISLGIAMALPYNAENINDTIYVANWGGLKPGNTSNCFIRVYDATNPSNIHLLTYINAGLWHFDMTVHYPKLYVASEWYGIKTVDITDILNPVDEGNTLTGGWNLSSDSWGNYMAVSNEGYGFKLYDISDVHNPVLTDVNNDPGFCFHSNFSDDGNYIFTTNSSYQGFRVYTRNPLQQISFIQQAVCNGRFIVYQHRIFSKLDNSIVIINVGNPAIPFVDSTVNITFNDMALANGKLLVSTSDSIFAFDVSGNKFEKIASVALASNQDAQMIAAYSDETFVYITNKGLTRYKLVFNNPGYSLNEEFYSTLANGAPNYMATDSFGLYLAYRLKGLYALNKQTFVQTGFYRGGLDYRKLSDQYGVRDLFCKNDKIFFVEYFAQTSILTNDSTYTSIPVLNNIEDKIMVYPNPSNSSINISFGSEMLENPKEIRIYSITGVLLHHSFIESSSENINISEFQNGMYFLNLYENNEIICTRKFIVGK
ncbi:MAG TPA: T9SS type A sorting domain-containing protein [Bacteroidales bacterium]|nr:T9SS type A sorting domain-containing protein [Bacteroidales bacterium]HPS15833.1 T9SS type A sorting domain-containing protein [Bacteroidales bacterium]